jgi:hypothetical protein
VKLHFHGLLVIAAVACGSCAGYRVGPVSGQVAGERSIQVTPFASKVIEPRVGDAVTTSLRRQLQQEGTYRLDTRGEANIVVTGSVIEYDRSHISFQPQDILTPRDYRLRLRAHVIARDRSTGRVLLDRDVLGHTTLRVSPDLASTERQAIPQAADELARNITALLTEGSW